MNNSSNNGNSSINENGNDSNTTTTPVILKSTLNYFLWIVVYSESLSPLFLSLSKPFLIIASQYKLQWFLCTHFLNLQLSVLCMSESLYLPYSFFYNWSWNKNVYSQLFNFQIIYYIFPDWTLLKPISLYFTQHIQHANIDLQLINHRVVTNVIFV